MKYLFILLLVLVSGWSFGSQKNNKTKTTIQKVAKPITQKIPLPLLVKVLDSTDKFVINDQTKFAHIDVPKSKYNQFIGYIKDSTTTEISGAKSLVYYNFTLKNGNNINGDIYWNDKKSYIVFTIDNKKYVNIFRLDGSQQLKTIFKL